MKKLKGMLIAAFIAIVGSQAFAQVPLVNVKLDSASVPALGQPSSFTSATTGGVFGTEVNNFMNVNNWGTVKPEKFFGYVGYDMGSGGIDIGFAKQLAPLYLGMSFDGKLGRLESVSISNTMNSDKSTKWEVDTTNKFTLQSLFGFGIFGLRAGLFYSPRNVRGDDDTASDTRTVTKSESYTIFPEIAFGFNVAAGDLSLSPWARVGVQANVNKTSTEVDGKVTESANSVTIGGTPYPSIYNIAVALGTGIALAPKDKVNQKFDVGIGVRGGILPTKSITSSVEATSKGAVDTDLKIDFAYKVTYSPTDKIALGLRTAVPIGFKFTNTAKTTDDTDIKYSVNNYITFAPSVGVGAEFWVKPEKFRINLGLTASLNPFGWHINEEVEANRDKSTTTSFLFNNAGVVAGDLTWGSGFTWIIAKKVQFDVDWKLMNGIFNNFTTTFNKEVTSNGFWGNVNQLFFHDLSFLIAVKL